MGVGQSPKRLDSTLEAAGAEFLVLGLMLVEGIQASKAYVNFPGYDIIATDPDAGTSVRVQVKSRWATDYDGAFLIRNFDADFVAFVELNRGYRYGRKQSASDGRKPPRVFVFPVDVVREAQSKASKWGKVFLRSISDVESYLDGWDQVRQKLAGTAPAPRGGPDRPSDDRVQLDDELERLLNEAGRPLRAAELAERVNAAKRYWKRDRSAMSPQQIHARVSKHSDRFERGPEGIGLKSRR